jgi:ankyrin repeat protein
VDQTVIPEVSIFQAFRATDPGAAILKLHRDGVDLTIRDDWGEGAIHYATAPGAGRVLKTLLRCGVPVESRNSGFRTALHQASYRQNLEAMRLLLESGADVNAQCRNKQTALHVCTDSAEAVDLLLRAGADYEIEDIWGYTVLQYLKGETADRARSRIHLSALISNIPLSGPEPRRRL